MDVIYFDGKKGTLSSRESAKLYVANRFTKDSWQQLEREMIKLKISKFKDSFLSSLGTDGWVSIDYVKNQIICHSR